MSQTPSTEIRPARRRDADRLAEFLRSAPPAPGGSAGADAVSFGDHRTRVLAISGGEIIGTGLYTPSAGRCAVVAPPRLREWDPTLAARLLRATAARAHAREGARLIQSLTEPEGRHGDQGPSPLASALREAGFDRLAVLSYMRRSIQPEDRRFEPPADLQWHRYSCLSHRTFARTITRTYTDSLDCPKLAGLRKINDTLSTHKHTGTFSPRTWRLVSDGGQTAGVAMVNDLQGRGELVYLGVVPEARGRGIGRALLGRAIRDTAELGLPQMGLAVDIANAPAVRLYEQAGFREIRRRLAYFIPAVGLDSLALSG